MRKKPTREQQAALDKHESIREILLQVAQEEGWLNIQCRKDVKQGCHFMTFERPNGDSSLVAVQLTGPEMVREAAKRASEEASKAIMAEYAKQRVN